MIIFLITVGIVGIFVALVVAFFLGEEYGVRATEQRWSNAVAKAEWADRYPTGVSLGIHGMRYDDEIDPDKFKTRFFTPRG
jgi:hypothetical protein